MGLNAADQRLVERDAGLPGLAHLLDADRFAELADRLAPQAGIASARLRYLRYKPGTSALAAFRLSCRDGATLTVQAKALAGSHFEVVAARLATLEPQPAAGPAPAAVERLQLVLLRPEDDRKLKAIRLLLDAARRPALLAALCERSALGESGGRGLDIDEVELLRYKPERRLVARLARRGRTVALLRVLARDDYGRGLLGAALGAATCGAALVGADAQQQALLTAWAPGATLDCRNAGADPCARTGAQLARLHRTRALPVLQRTRRDEAGAVQRPLAMLADLEPALEFRCRELTHRVARLLAASSWRPSTIHGDFSADQVIVDDERCRFIDWDRAAAGDAAADLGSFAARLEMQFLDGTLAREAADAAFAHLLQGYAGERPVPMPDVELQTAAALLQLAGESFRRRLPDWPGHEDALLSRAEAMLDRFERRRGPAVPAPRSPPVASRAMRAPDPLSLALDPHWAGPALRRALGPRYHEATLCETRLLRHKPGRHALLAYDLQHPERIETVLGKLRFKGLNRNAVEVQRALGERSAARARETAPGAAPAIVPQVLGIVPEAGLWLQRLLPGEPSERHFLPASNPAIARRVADALADLHDEPVATARTWSVGDELDMLRERLGRAARERPALAGRIEAVLAACIERAAGLPATPPTGIHRDFHPGQVLVDGERLVLLDFDLYAVGDPALDVGNFAAHLIELAVRRHGDPDALLPHRQALVGQYRSRRPAVGASAIEDWTALSLARHVELSLCHPDRVATTEIMLRLSERHLRIPDRPA